ncbi:MAG: prepilin-type N-terminal cleavage/methylation domain-containing protein [Planctomycetota bacterium]|jgi:prepilin-type N-terminal cleavage/methylation domain-containing protein|nr:prepilin-type N-terminal cleavage/methylation domain-containing protein [Planctomycetota bacterium]MDP7252750.1 prepilin-type N-terminal cleavage/methylation domain-containing protein [Planctomycetota bacterium]
MSPKLRARLKLGFTLIEVMTAMTIVASVSSGGYGHVMNRAKAMQCQNNLRQMGLVFKTMGKLPNAAFYPSGDPKSDPKSLLVIGKKAGLSESMFQCPTAPAEFREKGLTFLWNDSVNGRGPFSVSREWLVIEMNALSAKPTAPHAGKYHVLYGSGSVKAVSSIPKEIEKAKAMAKKKKSTGNANPRAQTPARPQNTPQQATTNTVVKTQPQPATPAVQETKDNSGFAKGNWVKVVKQGAELYSNKKVVARLQKDQELQVLGTNGSWVGVRVNVNGNWERGWIRKTNVTD